MIISTPAKVILSGEHSVVYGAPAVGAPLSLFLHARWTKHPEDRALVCSIAGQSVRMAESWADLPEKLKEYRRRHTAYKRGEMDIVYVLPDPVDLVTLTFACFYERFKGEAERLPGLTVAVETEIPPRSGLGSSSSLIVNLLRGLLKLVNRAMPDADLLSFARDIEHFQHGTSSGIDLALVSARQPLVFVKDKGVIGTLKSVPSGIVLVNTGKPAVSTGVCVESVRQFADDPALWSDFAACTVQIQTAFSNNDAQSLSAGVRENQKLLERIGVVPEKVSQFVAECANENIAAKICGAGATQGDAAGMVWALAGDDRSMTSLNKIAEKYGYTHGIYAIAN